MIGYLEDPLAEEDVEGWRKLLLKFKDSKVEIGTRKLYSNINKLKQVINKLLIFLVFVKKIFFHSGPTLLVKKVILNKIFKGL